MSSEPNLELLEDEVLHARTARERLGAYRDLVRRVEDYPVVSSRFERVQARVLADLAGLALEDLDLDDVEPPS